jgi:hypothetical protein
MNLDTSISIYKSESKMFFFNFRLQMVNTWTNQNIVGGTNQFMLVPTEPTK